MCFLNHKHTKHRFKCIKGKSCEIVQKLTGKILIPQRKVYADMDLEDYVNFFSLKDFVHAFVFHKV